MAQTASMRSHGLDENELRHRVSLDNTHKRRYARRDVPSDAFVRSHGETNQHAPTTQMSRLSLFVLTRALLERIIFSIDCNISTGGSCGKAGWSATRAAWVPPRTVLPTAGALYRPSHPIFRRTPPPPLLWLAQIVEGGDRKKIQKNAQLFDMRAAGLQGGWRKTSYKCVGGWAQLARPRVFLSRYYSYFACFGISARPTRSCVLHCDCHCIPHSRTRNSISHAPQNTPKRPSADRPLTQ